jgi:multisubunit Na+/H+ antiporter MnhG subunit
MKSNLRSVIFDVAATLMLLGAIAYIRYPHIACYMFAVGAAGYAVNNFTISTKEMNLREKRLQRLNVYASVLCLVASSLMFSQRKEWIICLTIAAIFQLYTAFVSPSK